MNEDLPDLTDDERIQLRYFHEEKGDVTRWVGWEDIRPKLARWHPEILLALDQHSLATKFLDAVIRAL